MFTILKKTKVQGEIISINVGLSREFDYNGSTEKSAIWKDPINGEVYAKGINLDGDEQADRKAHGGYDKAVYAYAMEDITWWEKKLHRKITPGMFGENLTLSSVQTNSALIGEKWKVGETILEVSEPRIPCWRLGVKFDDENFPKVFTKALRPGTYLRIIEEGALNVGDKIEIISKPSHSLSIRDVFEIYSKKQKHAVKILQASEISDAWKLWAENTIQRMK